MVPHPCISCIKSQHSPTGVSSAQRWRRNGNPILAIPKANISECLFYVDEMQAVEPSGAGSRCVRLSLGSGRAVPSQQLRAWQSLAELGLRLRVPVTLGRALPPQPSCSHRHSSHRPWPCHLARYSCSLLSSCAASVGGCSTNLFCVDFGLFPLTVTDLNKENKVLITVLSNGYIGASLLTLIM